MEAVGSPGCPVLAVYEAPQADLERCPEGNRLQGRVSEMKENSRWEETYWNTCGNEAHHLEIIQEVVVIVAVVVVVWCSSSREETS